MKLEVESFPECILLVILELHSQISDCICASRFPFNIIHTVISSEASLPFILYLQNKLIVSSSHFPAEAFGVFYEK